MTLEELAERLGAELRPGADGNLAAARAIEITGLNGIESAGPTEVTFVANQAYARLAAKTGAAAIIVEPAFHDVPVATVRVKNPYFAWAKTIELMYPALQYAPGVHPMAAIDPTAEIGKDVHIAAFAVIGAGCVVGDGSAILSHAVLYPGVKLGSRCLIHAHAVVREGCVLGDEVVLQNGVVIGADGFGFAKDATGRWSKIHQAGRAVLEDRVEVQANACVDRASIGETKIGEGTKIDNLVMVGHGSTVGSDTLLCSQVGLAGSTTVGNKVILAGQVGAAGHLTIGDGAVATAQTGIASDVAAGALVSGTPATDNRTWLRTSAALNRLPELVRRVRSLEKSMEALAPAESADPETQMTEKQGSAE
ncbi:UDP-3-O-[3-hydroxymyristoyl] glucosamine N-acyltransferase [Bryocella elongata]|uniref:UDP-3-O-acylglucosamine N-acyltransferase n=1 Tax=Bryocella elongata TaxID=863522 RepID=A0A1H5TWV6_9BACT|nr:UDP-3-O-(3-hydroxymyristoyl)glucosamine N-acyltransferase [Bryocella elongata]SEF66507.1 UDP-3-O-[3-hydroxymyristoyl] glucosamine N-acyltransferase [Bryocella elongata]